MTWLDGGANRIKITIDGSKIEEDLIDFPIMIPLNYNIGNTMYDAMHIFDILTTSSGDGSYNFTTTYSVAHYIIALDDNLNIQYNITALDKMILAVFGE